MPAARVAGTGFAFASGVACNARMRRRLLALPCLILALMACSHTAPDTTDRYRSPLAEWVPSPNFEPRRPVLVVLHATEQTSVAQSLHTLRNANSGGPVSAHYLIGEDGRIYQLVADDQRAWHAGAGRWGVIDDVNNASIGIELDNDGAEPFTDAQMDALVRLLDDLTRRLGIARTAIIAHADMAPTRKRDPGAHFPWKRLFDAGFGIWPQADAPPPPPDFDPWRALRLLGYPTAHQPATVRAFHRRFRGIDDGENPDARLDAEDLRILHALTR